MCSNWLPDSCNSICPAHYGNTCCGVFKRGGTKSERFLPNNEHTQRKLLNFENWVNGEVLKIGYHFRKQSDLKIDVINKCQ